MSSFVEQQNMLPEMRRGASINTAANYFAELKKRIGRSTCLAMAEVLLWLPIRPVTWERAQR